MPSANALVARGISRETVDATIEVLGVNDAGAALRREAFDRYSAVAFRPSPGGRYWKHDLSKLDLSEAVTVGDVDAATVSSPLPGGVTVVPLSSAPSATTLVDKVGLLAAALENAGVLVTIAPGAQIDEPIVISYDARHTSLFPRTIVRAGKGSRATVVENIVTHRDDAGGHALVFGSTEIFADENAHVSYASLQEAAAPERIIFSRRATCAANARVEWSLAALGGTVVADTIVTSLDAAGATSSLAALFFATQSQHVDLSSEVRHDIGHTQSETIVKSAANGHGQGRYVGNIVIKAHAHGADASLRDDTLLLSKDAHIDSIPALEIAANDVKAFHGATVGSISDEEIFYAQSRGIPRADAEKMIALGFFEPAISRFPGEALRERLRSALEAKIEEPSA